MQLWYYFSRATNMQLHDLTLATTDTPKNMTSLVGLGMQFIPIPRSTKQDVDATINRFRKDFFTKVYFSGRPIEHKEEFIPKLHVPSDWEPKFWDLPPPIIKRFEDFAQQIRAHFKKKRRHNNNLLPTQKLSLKTLKSRPDLLIVNSDKKCGPVLIETSTYINRAYDDHLATATYKELTAESAAAHMRQVQNTVSKWRIHHKNKEAFNKQEDHYLSINLNPKKEHKLPVFYLTIKRHKTPWSTRPIVSCSGSLLYYLGVWVDLHLAVIAKKQPSYLGSSHDLKQILDTTDLPPNASLFIADAESMYTSIRTDMALIEIAQFVHQREHLFKDTPTDAMLEALSIIMKNNVFQFGDTYWHQLTGTAMGTPPACQYANLFFAIHERRIMPRFRQHLLIYKRYIDDIFGIWLHDPDPAVDKVNWLAFQHAIGSYHGLNWVFSSRVKSINYLDITISLTNDLTINTTLFEKEISLFLYIPPHSAHPPGVITGLILGMCHRIYTLCSDDREVFRLQQIFYRRLTARGHNKETLVPLFTRAHEKYSHLRTSPQLYPLLNDDDMLDTRIFLHTKYHPSNPTSSTLQRIWNSTILLPPTEDPLHHVENKHGHEIELTKMTVAYSRHQNLINLLSYRNLHLAKGPPVSSYRIRYREGL